VGSLSGITVQGAGGGGGGGGATVAAAGGEAALPAATVAWAEEINVENRRLATQNDDLRRQLQNSQERVAQLEWQLQVACAGELPFLSFCFGPVRQQTQPSSQPCTVA
jgi:hypothetical protein